MAFNDSWGAMLLALVDEVIEPTPTPPTIPSQRSNSSDNKKHTNSSRTQVSYSSLLSSSYSSTTTTTTSKVSHGSKKLSNSSNIRSVHRRARRVPLPSYKPWRPPPPPPPKHRRNVGRGRRAHLRSKDLISDLSMTQIRKKRKAAKLKLRYDATANHSNKNKKSHYDNNDNNDNDDNDTEQQSWDDREREHERLYSEYQRRQLEDPLVVPPPRPRSSSHHDTNDYDDDGNKIPKTRVVVGKGGKEKDNERQAPSMEGTIYDTSICRGRGRRQRRRAARLHDHLASVEYYKLVANERERAFKQVRGVWHMKSTNAILKPPVNRFFINPSTLSSHQPHITAMNYTRNIKYRRRPSGRARYLPRSLRISLDLYRGIDHEARTADRNGQLRWRSFGKRAPTPRGLLTAPKMQPFNPAMVRVYHSRLTSMPSVMKQLPMTNEQWQHAYRSQSVDQLNSREHRPYLQNRTNVRGAQLWLRHHFSETPNADRVSGSHLSEEEQRMIYDRPRVPTYMDMKNNSHNNGLSSHPKLPSMAASSLTIHRGEHPSTKAAGVWICIMFDFLPADDLTRASSVSWQWLLARSLEQQQRVRLHAIRSLALATWDSHLVRLEPLLGNVLSRDHPPAGGYCERLCPIGIPWRGEIRLATGHEHPEPSGRPPSLRELAWAEDRYWCLAKMSHPKRAWRHRVAALEQLWMEHHIAATLPTPTAINVVDPHVDSPDWPSLTQVVGLNNDNDAKVPVAASPTLSKTAKAKLKKERKATSTSSSSSSSSSVAVSSPTNSTTTKSLTNDTEMELEPGTVVNNNNAIPLVAEPAKVYVTEHERNIATLACERRRTELRSSLFDGNSFSPLLGTYMFDGNACDGLHREVIILSLMARAEDGSEPHIPVGTCKYYQVHIMCEMHGVPHARYYAGDNGDREVIIQDRVKAGLVLEMGTATVTSHGTLSLRPRVAIECGRTDRMKTFTSTNKGYSDLHAEYYNTLEKDYKQSHRQYQIAWQQPPAASKPTAASWLELYPICYDGSLANQSQAKLSNRPLRLAHPLLFWPSNVDRLIKHRDQRLKHTQHHQMKALINNDNANNDIHNGTITSVDEGIDGENEVKLQKVAPSSEPSHIPSYVRAIVAANSEYSPKEAKSSSSLPSSSTDKVSGTRPPSVVNYLPMCWSHIVTDKTREPPKTSNTFESLKGHSGASATAIASSTVHRYPVRHAASSAPKRQRSTTAPRSTLPIINTRSISGASTSSVEVSPAHKRGRHHNREEFSDNDDTKTSDDERDSTMMATLYAMGLPPVNAHDITSDSRYKYWVNQHVGGLVSGRMDAAYTVRGRRALDQRWWPGGNRRREAPPLKPSTRRNGRGFRGGPNRFGSDYFETQVEAARRPGVRVTFDSDDEDDPYR
jgi:hypothetical protein